MNNLVTVVVFVLAFKCGWLLAAWLRARKEDAGLRAKLGERAAGRTESDQHITVTLDAVDNVTPVLDGIRERMTAMAKQAEELRAKLMEGKK